MKTIIKLIIKDFIRFRKDKAAVVLTFLVPMVLILIFGYIFGGSGPRGKAQIILVNESNSIVARMIEQKLDSSKSIQPIKTYKSGTNGKTIKFDEATAIQWIKEGKISAAVVMPKEFFSDTSSSLKFNFYYDPKSEIESAIIQGNIQQIIMTQSARLMPVLMQRKALNYLGSDSTKHFLKSLGNIAEKYFDVSADSFINRLTEVDSAKLYSSTKDTGLTSENNFMSGLIKFDSEQVVGVNVANPGLTRTVGGWAMMFMLFSLTGAATSLFEEKQEGTMKRLLCMPVTRTQILWEKYLYTLILGVIQLLVLFVFSWMLFGIDIFNNFGNLLIVIVASASAAVAFGMLITSFAKTLNQVSGISTLVILVISAIGGSWFPTSLLPNWMQVASKATLTYWSVEAFLQVLWRQAPFSAILPNVIILLLMALLVNSYLIIRFKRGLIF